VRPRRVVTNLFIIAVGLFLVAFFACREGSVHDQSGFCVIDPFMPPPFLGFEYWSQVGITLAVAATGMIIAALLYLRNNS